MTDPRLENNALITDYGSNKIKVGSLSFSFAASLLGKRAKAGIFWLYAWCRECDDLIDDPAIANQPDLMKERIEKIRRLTLENSQDDSLAFSGMRQLFSTYQIPKYYAEELIKGMEMDISIKRYRNMDELLCYCYRVAGTVGLMSCSIFGLKSASALKNAESLGMAMQLTNIARDVFDDFRMGRVYLPLDILEEEHISDDRLLAENHREGLVKAVAKILAAADHMYQLGFKGTIYLPWRCAFAVITAGLIYRDIGRIIINRGPHAWDNRAIVSKNRKLFLAFVGFLKITVQIPQRILSAQKSIPVMNARINSWSNP